MVRPRLTPVAPAAAPSAPAWWRDPWCLLAGLAIVPAWWAARGTPLGEPFADDFDFLHHVFFGGRWQLLDGGGGGLYWRPLARQAYYGLLAPLLLAHPLVVALLHAAAFALAAMLVQRALRASLGAPAAAFAASFALLLPGVRVMLAWPSGAQDLGVVLALAAALHALACGRTGRALVAVAAALLCKEVALPLAFALPLVPLAALHGRRRAFALRLGALLAVWTAAHEGVRVLAHQLPLTAVTGGNRDATPLFARIGWALASVARDAAAWPASQSALAWGAVALAALLLTAALLRGPAARARGAAALPWCAWGLAWCALGAAPLAPYHPAWADYRSVAPALGLGIALAACAAAAPLALVPLAALRLAGLLLAPGAPERIEVEWRDHGAAFDFPRLVQVQRFVAEARRTLTAAHATLPAGAVIVRHAWPRTTDYAFENGRALQVWYRDSTLRYVSFESFSRDPQQRADAVLEFQPHREPQLTLVSPEALRALLRGVAAMRAGDMAAGLAATDSAIAAQRDTASALFLATANAKRAVALFALGRAAAAESAAARAYAWYADDRDARVLLAQAALTRGDRARAAELLQMHLARYPDDAQAQAMLAPLAVER